jgi:hypothetical protein
LHLVLIQLYQHYHTYHPSAKSKLPHSTNTLTNQPSTSPSHIQTSTQRTIPTPVPHQMSLYPNIIDTSASNTILAPCPQIPMPHSAPSPSKPPHTRHTHHHILAHHLSSAVLAFLSHMFAPASYLACTCSTPCWAPTPLSPYNQPTHDEKGRVVLEDDTVVLDNDDDEEEDGGPLCRESTIASWKACEKKERQQWRRRILQWMTDVMQKARRVRC